MIISKQLQGLADRRKNRPAGPDKKKKDSSYKKKKDKKTKVVYILI